MAGSPDQFELGFRPRIPVAPQAAPGAAELRLAVRDAAIRQGLAEREAEARDAATKAALGDLLTGNVYGLQDRLGRAVLRAGGLTPPENMTLPQMFAEARGHPGSPGYEMLGDTLRDPMVPLGLLAGGAGLPLQVERAVKIGSLIPAAISTAQALPRFVGAETPEHEAAAKEAALERLDAARSR